MVLGWLLDRFRRHAPHSAAREIGALVSCMVAWRRACLETYLQDAAGTVEDLGEELEALREYVHELGGVDPFTTYVLDVPIGALDEELLLGATWRIETAGAIAWGLGLLDRIQPVEERTDVALLSDYFPFQTSPSRSFTAAVVRDRSQILAERDRWRAIEMHTRRDRDARPNEPEVAFAFSRAFERARGLTWMASDARWVEDVDG